MLAFTDKVKIIKSYVPEKVKIYIENNLSEELKYFQKKYSFKIEIYPDEKLIIPEYVIELCNKSKKVIKKFENVKIIKNITTKTKDTKKGKKEVIKLKKETKKPKKRRY